MTTVGSGLQILGESGEHARELEAKVVSLKIVDGVVNYPHKDAFGPHSTPSLISPTEVILILPFFLLQKNGKEWNVRLSQLPRLPQMFWVIITLL